MIKEKEKLLEIEHYSYRYMGNEQHALKDITFSLYTNDFVLVSGPSGSGKSTLLRQLKRELVPAGMMSGSVSIKGINLEHMTHRESAEVIGFIGQNIQQQLVTERVWQEIVFGMENLGWTYDRIQKKTDEMVKFFELQDIFYKKTNQLSGGQRQRVLLASVMAMEPEILLLDEPTSQLDEEMAKELLYELYRLNKKYKTAIIIVEHRLRHAIRFCNRFCKMSDGRMTEIPKEQVEIPSFSWPNQLLSTKSNCETIISIEDLTFYYEKENPVFQHFQLSVSKGSFYSIIGRNGIGKSTLLHLICGIKKPITGNIACYGKVALVPQNPKALFTEVTVEDELKNKELLEQLQLTALKQCHPYDLSGGQQQRLALGKVLEVKPDILLLDEPTKGLDYDLKEILGSILETLNRKGVTILCVSHDIEFCERYGTTYQLSI